MNTTTSSGIGIRHKIINVRISRKFTINYNFITFAYTQNFRILENELRKKLSLFLKAFIDVIKFDQHFFFFCSCFICCSCCLFGIYSSFSASALRTSYPLDSCPLFLLSLRGVKNLKSFFWMKIIETFIIQHRFYLVLDFYHCFFRRISFSQLLNFYSIDLLSTLQYHLTECSIHPCSCLVKRLVTIGSTALSNSGMKDPPPLCSSTLRFCLMLGLR